MMFLGLYFEPIKIPQSELMRLANKWEPEASQSPPGYRAPTCVKCGRKMFFRMWHLWLNYVDEHGKHWVKELHMCRSCGREYQ